jgi:hypothetical protein
MQVQKREHREDDGQGGIAHGRILAQMHSLEPELRALLTPDNERAIGALIARERRDVFSVYPELRIAGWLGATTLAAAAGIVLKNNLEHIGPGALAVLMAVAAAACYAWTWFRRARASVVDDYVLLLGALLVSADVAFVESQFHLFDANWKHHLLIVAIFHAIGAYAYGSRMLLSLSILALAAWIGYDTSRPFDELVIPALATAALLIVWREADRRLHATGFSRTFEHFAANIALTGALTLLIKDEVRGGLVILAIAVAVIAWGFRTRSEPFVLYGFVYVVIGFDAVLLEQVGDGTLAYLIIVVSMIAAIAGLLALHARFRTEVPR